MGQKEIARQSRIKCLELVHRAGTSHIGSLMSCAEILTSLFDIIDFDKDTFIAGKSWAAAQVYYHLWRRGRITEEQLNSFCQPGSRFIGLVENVTKDLPFGIGSMGYGLSAGCGFAWSKLQRGSGGRVFVLESDGGFHEGSTWEALMFAAHHKLDNLVCLLDKNGFSAMGKTAEILDQEYLGKALVEMGWATTKVNGHDLEQLRWSLTWEREKPLLIIAETIKGKGISFMENSNLWHYAQVKDDDYEKALAELHA